MRVHPGVNAAGQHQLRVGAAFDDTTAVEDEYLIRVPDRGQPVGDDERRAAALEVAQALEDEAL